MLLRLETAPGGLALHSPYDAAFVAALKAAVPANARSWDKARRAWLIDPAHADRVVELVSVFYGQTLTVPEQAGLFPSAPELRMLTIEYIGACKVREGQSEQTALGYCEGTWSVVLPEPVLRAWFELGGNVGTPAPAEPGTLYAELGVAQDANSDAIKRAYRRLAKVWHPDVNREPDAAERFKRYADVYAILSDPKTRRKYDAGLALEASIEQPRARRRPVNTYGYRAPLTCGLLLAQGTSRVGRFVVSQILSWEDVTDTQGRTLVTSWPQGADIFERAWV